MATQNAALKRLLSSDLPTDRLGPHLRNACRRAVRSGGTERMRLVARVVVAELDRRGDLKPVVLEDPKDGRRLFLIRGTSRLVDLTIVGDVIPDPTPSPAVHQPDPAPSPGPVSAPTEDSVSEPVRKPEPAPSMTKPVGPEPPAFNFHHFIGMLGAMEHAQDLDLGDAVSSDRGTILAGVVDLLQRFTPQFQLFVMLQDGVVPPDDQESLFVLPGSEVAKGWVAARAPGHSVWIPRYEELPAPIRSSLNKKFEGRFQARASVAVPLWEPRDEDNGVAHQESGLLFMVTGHEEGRDELLSLAQRLSRFVTRRWQQQQEMNQRIHVDSLTRVFNRGYFDSQFTLELERARRSDVPLSLVIADLDHFKGVNDTFGHQSGDVVLRMAARRLQEELRRIDHVCRIGGEEFALILPATSQDAAQEVVGRLLDSDFSCRVFHDGSEVDLKVTFSFGAVSFPSAGADPFELFRKADSMLYLSKDLGRNRCHFWSSDEIHTQLLPTPMAD